MKKVLCFLIFSVGWAEILTFNIPAHEYDIIDNELSVLNASYINPIGMPDIPCRVVTIALPPGAELLNIKFHGSWQPLGNLHIKPALPPYPLMNDNVYQTLYRQYENAQRQLHSNAGQYPNEYGKLISHGGLRKYRIMTVACFHFAYNPSSGILFHSPNISIDIEYKKPAPPDLQSEYWQRLLDDVTCDSEAEQMIHNWDQAQTWYHTDNPHRANGYYIILPSSLQSSVSALAAHRQSQGYDVQIVTREYIEANVVGIDIQQKFRNYLRQNISDIEYVLLVGFSSDMPWRNLVPFNNDPDSPWNNPDYSPIPSDLYLAELTDPDSISWNSDGDAYYGEVYDENFNPVGEDDPDYHADIRLARIPFSTPSVIEDIIAKLVAFDINTNISYKTAGLLTGALYYYENENNSGNRRMDGGEYCERFLIDSILPRATTVTLYEKQGLAPCTLDCTDTLHEANHIAYWQNKGIMYECHHGNVSIYARKLWAWDDGDSIPENNEITWPTSLQSSDVYQLDNAHPATCFLRSCLCGKPEQTGLGAMLLYRGGSNVISSSRVSWASSADINGIPYHFYKHLLQDTTISRGITGPSYDIAKNIYMNNTGFWLPPYHYNMFGDPALRQYGRLVGTDELTNTIQTINIYPNPSTGMVVLNYETRSLQPIFIKIYDVGGRIVKVFNNWENNQKSQAIDLHLPTGVYFLNLRSGSFDYQKKIVIIE